VRAAKYWLAPVSRLKGILSANTNKAFPDNRNISDRVDRRQLTYAVKEQDFFLNPGTDHVP
jgi:hypothetical protein